MEPKAEQLPSGDVLKAELEPGSVRRSVGRFQAGDVDELLPRPNLQGERRVVPLKDEERICVEGGEGRTP